MKKRKKNLVPPPSEEDEKKPEEYLEEETATTATLDPEEYTGVKKEGKSEEEKAAAVLDDLKTQLDDDFKLGWTAQTQSAEVMKEDINFYSGNQWTDEERAKLEGQGRPVLTFNKIKPIIKLLTGHMLQNSARLQVSPEGGEDQKFSEVMDKMVDHIDEVSQLEFHMGYLFAGGEKAGRSWIEFHQDYSNDPIFGEMKSIYHGPFKIIPDPRGTAYDLSDRQFCFKIVHKTKSELKELYPEKAEVIEAMGPDDEDPTLGIASPVEGDANNYGNDKGKKKTGLNASTAPGNETDDQRQYTVKEYWYLKREDRFFVYFVNKGDMPKFKTEDEAKAEIEKRKAKFLADGGQEPDWKTIMRKRKVRVMCVAIKVAGEILTQGLSPFEPYYSGFPFFQFIADWNPEADKEEDKFCGIVRSLKDPQREKNKARSQFLHILGTAANSGWIGDDDALTDPQWNELKNFGSTPGIALRKKKGSALDRIQPVAPDLANQVREKAANDDFKEVSGVNSDLLAVDQSSNPSGKAIALRIRQAITILETDFRNFRYTKKLIGQFLFKVIPTLFDVAKMKKVLGENFLRKAQVSDVDLRTFLVLIEDGKYNVRIAEQGNTKTMREETFEDLMEMVKSGMPIPFDVMADFMTFPNKTEVLDKVRQFQEQQQAAAIAAAQTKGTNGAASKTPPMRR
jgi:hypothetical protein